VTGAGGDDRSLDVAAAEPAFVVFHPDDAEYAGRVRTRSAILALRPERPRRIEPRHPDPDAPPGAAWKLVAPNEVTIAMCAGDFPSIGEAVHEIDRLARKGRLSSVVVRDPASGRLSFWVLDGDAVAAVSARMLPPTRRRVLEHDAALTLRTIRDPVARIARSVHGVQ
jgi:hypothetical protein